VHETILLRLKQAPQMLNNATLRSHFSGTFACQVVGGLYCIFNFFHNNILIIDIVKILKGVLIGRATQDINMRQYASFLSSLGPQVMNYPMRPSYWLEPTDRHNLNSLINGSCGGILGQTMVCRVSGRFCFAHTNNTHTHTRTHGGSLLFFVRVARGGVCLWGEFVSEEGAFFVVEYCSSPRFIVTFTSPHLFLFILPR
jgi:hypothetical protein